MLREFLRKKISILIIELYSIKLIWIILLYPVHNTL